MYLCLPRKLRTLYDKLNHCSGLNTDKSHIRHVNRSDICPHSYQKRTLIISQTILRHHPERCVPAVGSDGNGRQANKKNWDIIWRRTAGWMQAMPNGRAALYESDSGFKTISTPTQMCWERRYQESPLFLTGFRTVHFWGETDAHRYFTSWHQRGLLETKAVGFQPLFQLLR